MQGLLHKCFELAKGKPKGVLKEVWSAQVSNFTGTKIDPSQWVVELLWKEVMTVIKS